MKTKYYTVNEVADIIGLSPKTVYSYLYGRKIFAKKLKFSGQWRIPESSIEDLMEDHLTREEILNQMKG